MIYFMTTSSHGVLKDPLAPLLTARIQLFLKDKLQNRRRYGGQVLGPFIICLSAGQTWLIYNLLRGWSSSMCQLCHICPHLPTSADLSASLLLCPHLCSPHGHSSISPECSLKTGTEKPLSHFRTQPRAAAAGMGVEWDGPRENLKMCRSSAAIRPR